MNTSSGFQSDGFGRYATLALVAVLLVSAIGGVIGGGVAAAQQGGTGGNNTTAGNGTAGNATPSANGGNNSTAANPVNATIQDFRRAEQVPWNETSAEEKRTVRSALERLASSNPTRSEQNEEVATITGAILYDREVAGIPMNRQPEAEAQIEKAVETNINGTSEGVGIGTDPNASVSQPFWENWDVPSLISTKLDAVADSMRKGAASILTDLYNLAFSTPVPENSGWNSVLGTPVDTKANQTFHALYQTLLVETLYPVTYSLLSVAIIFMAISMAGNPFMSHHQVVNYLINLVLAIMYWAFAWVGVTLMHGAVNEITLWIRPSPEVMGELVTNVEALSAGAVGAYLTGSSGIMATLFTLGVELGMRRVLLVYVFPYIFPALLLVLYLSPWQRLRGYASMALWQYVNVLTMTIPIAVLLRAAAVVSLDIQGKPDVVAMLILVGLFAVAATIPFLSTYFYVQVPGFAKKAAKRGTSGAYGRLGDAKDKIGWGGDESASDSTASGGSSPGDTTDEAVAASLDSRPGSSGSDSQSSTSTSTSLESSAESSGLPSSGTVDSMPDTTAGWVRELHHEKNRDPMNDDAMIEAFVDDQSRRTTTNYNPSD